jgi:branched-chain amino acid aminotransferase
MNFICVNGELIADAAPVWQADNRGYRYGDGLFETMRLAKGKIQLADFHFHRLFAGMTALKMNVPDKLNPKDITDQILQLSQKNGCQQSARVRLSVNGGDGGLYDNPRQVFYLIECWPLSPPAPELNRNGLLIGICPDVRKSTDRFSNLKSANFLPYVIAAKHATENGLNDCLVLNAAGKIADSTIANLFIIKNGSIITPASDQGCVAGVMRRYLLESSRTGLEFSEGIVGEEELREADEVFLTNALFGIKWVRQFKDKQYGNATTKRIYKDIMASVP